MNPRLIVKLASLSLFLVALACEKQADKSIIKDYSHHRDRYKFEYTTTFEGEWRYSDADASYRMIMKQIRYHSNYLVGVFTRHTGDLEKGLPDYSSHPGGVVKRPDVSISKLEPINETRVKITYTYKDQLAIKNTLEISDNKLKFLLPGKVVSEGRNYSTPLFRMGRVRRNKASDVLNEKELKILEKIEKDTGRTLKSVNPCTDLKYQTLGDFWYFWNPFHKGCASLLSNSILVEATVEAIADTTETFPQYQRLYENSQTVDGKKTLKGTVIMGAYGEVSNPEDLKRQQFDNLTWNLGGYNLNNQKFDLNLVEKIEYVDGSVVARFHRTGSFDVELDVVFTRSSTGASNNDEKFQRCLFEASVRDAIGNSDIFIYNGHSGLGGNLPPSRFVGSNYPELDPFDVTTGVYSGEYIENSYKNIDCESRINTQGIKNHWVANQGQPEKPETKKTKSEPTKKGGE